MIGLRVVNRLASVLLEALLALALLACRPPDPTPELEEAEPTLPPPTPSQEVASTYTAEPLVPNSTPMLVTATPAPIDLDGAPLADDAYLLPLTVQHVTDTSATLLFELMEPAA